MDSFRVRPGHKLRLADHATDATGEYRDKDAARKHLERGIEKLRALQEQLYAQDRWSVLLIFQAMDGAGKDSTIEHVLSGVNPQGCQVFSFKAPSAEELDHDFLWRTNRCLPERGRIGVFNRSYYEEVLVVRVHPEILAAQHLPKPAVTPKIWQERFEDIASMERYLSRNGTLIRKFFLHISRDEQRQRFLDRLEDPAKHWKFALGDVEERKRWDDYMAAYQNMIAHTSTEAAPWYVIPADRKWFARLAVADVIVEALEELKLAYPQVPPDKRAELDEARRRLEKD